MKFIKVPKEGINIAHLYVLYVRMTCLHCQEQYGSHVRNVDYKKTCPCGYATFYVSLKQYGRWLGFAVVWIGRFENAPETIKEIDVDIIEVAKVEAALYEEIDQEEQGE